MAKVCSLSEIVQVLVGGNDFFIAGHVDPDGDSIGSCFGLGMALEKLGKNVQVLLDPFHQKYNVIPGQHLIGNKKLQNPMLVCVDCADIDRLTSKARELFDSLEDSICIDHHYTNTCFAKYNYVEPNIASNCEVVYRLLDGLVELDKDIASALYAGIISDTGGFRYQATSKDTLNLAARLVEVGISFTEIYTEIFHVKTYTEVKLLAKIIENATRCQDGRVVYACVTKDMMTNLGDAPPGGPGELDGVVDSLLNIKQAQVAVLIYDRCVNGEYKVSMRSRSINIGNIARKLGGGGHQLAAGATVKDDMNKIRDKVLKYVYEALSEAL